MKTYQLQIISSLQTFNKRNISLLVMLQCNKPNSFNTQLLKLLNVANSVSIKSQCIFENATSNDFETQLTVTDQH